MLEPAWFYSSLSQVTAAIVGFVGGFLVLRLLNVISEWRELGVRLTLRQSAWARASREAEQTPIGEIEGPLPKAYSREDDAWADLYRAIEERNKASLPAEISVGAVVLMLLLGVGTVWPLLALRDPENSSQLIFIIPWSLLVLAFGLLISWRTQKTLQDLRGIQLSNYTKARLDEYEMQIEAWKEQDRWEEEQRQAKEKEGEES